MQDQSISNFSATTEQHEILSSPDRVGDMMASRPLIDNFMLLGFMILTIVLVQSLTKLVEVWKKE